MKHPSLTRILRRSDPYYRPISLRHDFPRRWNYKKRLAWKQSRDAHRLKYDNRTQEERDRATLGAWYDWAVAMKAEEAHAARVAKAQATLQYRAKTVTR